jgi:hypothetical protein
MNPMRREGGSSPSTITTHRRCEHARQQPDLSVIDVKPTPTREDDALWLRRPPPPAVRSFRSKTKADHPA